MRRRKGQKPSCEGNTGASAEKSLSDGALRQIACGGRRIRGLSSENATHELSEVVSKERKGAKRAALRYRRLRERETEQGVLTLAEIELETGRHHQIRVQTAHAACPSGGIKNIIKAFRSAAKRRLRSGLTAWRASIPIRNSRFPLPPSPKGSRFHFFSEELTEL